MLSLSDLIFSYFPIQIHSLLIQSLSGGKDSLFNLMHCVAHGHDLIALANLHPPSASQSDELDSFMFQTVGHDMIEWIACSLDLPLVRVELHGSSLQTGSIYNENIKTSTTSLCQTKQMYTRSSGALESPLDEVEDLYALLKTVKDQFPSVDAVSVGAILSNYQRVRVENVCGRLGLTVLSFLWRRDQVSLVQKMVDVGLYAVLVKVASIGLEERHLGRSLDEMLPLLRRLHGLYGVHVAGEGGEYETLVLDCPLFKKRIVVNGWQEVMHSDDAFAPVAFLKPSAIKLEDKDEDVRQLALVNALNSLRQEYEDFWSVKMVDDSVLNESPQRLSDASLILPSTRTAHLTDTLLLTNLSAATGSDIETETEEIFQSLSQSLNSDGFTFSDIVMVHVYLRHMDDFASMNAVYQSYFGVNHPASRACFSLPFSKTSSNIRIDLYAVKERMTDRMHVQSRSAWAPANIGPYSQSVHVQTPSLSNPSILTEPVLSSSTSQIRQPMGRIYVSGQIGLLPASMTFPKANSPEEQIRIESELARRHVRSVLLASVFAEKSTLQQHRDHEKCENRIQNTFAFELDKTNIGVTLAICYVRRCPGTDDFLSSRSWQRGWFDTWRPPMMGIVVENLPRHACVEWEIQAMTSHDIFGSNFDDGDQDGRSRLVTCFGTLTFTTPFY